VLIRRARAKVAEGLENDRLNDSISTFRALGRREDRAVGNLMPTDSAGHAVKNLVFPPVRQSVMIDGSTLSTASRGPTKDTWPLTFTAYNSRTAFRMVVDAPSELEARGETITVTR
jgi:hypothetical protein